MLFTIDMLPKKINVVHFQAEIYGSNHKLLEAWMINGKIDVDIPEAIAKLTNWKAPIRIDVHQGSNAISNTGECCC